MATAPTLVLQSTFEEDGRKEERNLKRMNVELFIIEVEKMVRGKKEKLG
jgi:hypothetical protein